MTIYRFKRHYRLRLLKKAASSKGAVLLHKERTVKITHIKQDTLDWHQTRMKIPTASEFDKIITYGGKASDQQIAYMYQIIYQRIYKQYARDMKPTFWMQRGKRLEKEALKILQERLMKPIEGGTFLTTNDGKVGCSPDGIITDGWEAAEIKCPEPWRHIMYTAEGPLRDYKAQLQGLMYVGDFSRVHFFSYCPGMPYKVHTIERDEAYIEELNKQLYGNEKIEGFVHQLETKEHNARSLGNYGELVIDEQNNTVECATGK